MQATYRALRRGNQLQWLDGAPKHIDNTDEIPVQITILNIADNQMSTKTQGERMADVLEQLSQADITSTQKDDIG